MQDKVHPSVAKDYYRVIPKSEAVTFKGILTKLDRWQYSSLQEFQADILSVDRNCRKYNSYGGGQFGNPTMLEESSKMLEAYTTAAIMYAAEIHIAEEALAKTSPPPCPDPAVLSSPRSSKYRIPSAAKAPSPDSEPDDWISMTEQRPRLGLQIPPTPLCPGSDPQLSTVGDRDPMSPTPGAASPALCRAPSLQVPPAPVSPEVANEQSPQRSAVQLPPGCTRVPLEKARRCDFDCKEAEVRTAGTSQGVAAIFNMYSKYREEWQPFAQRAKESKEQHLARIANIFFQKQGKPGSAKANKSRRSSSAFPTKTPGKRKEDAWFSTSPKDPTPTSAGQRAQGVGGPKPRVLESTHRQVPCIQIGEVSLPQKGPQQTSTSARGLTPREVSVALAGRETPHRLPHSPERAPA